MEGQFTADYLDNLYFYNNSGAGFNTRKNDRYQCYPNPVINKLTITSPVEIGELNILNVLGQSIKSVVVNGLSQTIELNDVLPEITS